MKRPWSMILIVLLLLGTLGCVLPIAQPAAPTAQVITVVVQPSAQPTQPPAPTAEPTAAPTAAPTQAPTQAPSLPRADFNGISFNYPQTLAANVSYEIVPANPPTPDSPGWDVYPQYTQFKFNSYVLSNTFHEPVIMIYPTAEYAAMQSYVADEISRLAQVLATQPMDFSGNASLPLLPTWNAAQMIQTKVSYFRFSNGSGVRFLTQYGQAIYPVNNNSLFYTYQGLTDDGKYYVAAILPVNHPGLPNTPEEGIPNGDWQAFGDNYTAYLAQIEPWMDSLPDDSFTPALAELDAMMASLNVNP